MLFLVEGVRSDRSQTPDREGENHSFVQNENICPRPDRGKIPVLVLPSAVEKVQKVDWRNRVSEENSRKKPH